MCQLWRSWNFRHQSPEAPRLAMVWISDIVTVVSISDSIGHEWTRGFRLTWISWRLSWQLFFSCDSKGPNKGSVICQLKFWNLNMWESIVMITYVATSQGPGKVGIKGSSGKETLCLQLRLRPKKGCRQRDTKGTTWKSFWPLWWWWWWWWWGILYPLTNGNVNPP